jgi:hypothetical protein
MRLGKPVQRVAQNLPQIVRKHVRENRRAFDQASVSVARLLAGPFMPVDKDDIAPALLEMQRRGNADNSRTQDQNIGFD